MGTMSESSTLHGSKYGVHWSHDRRTASGCRIVLSPLMSRDHTPLTVAEQDSPARRRSPHATARRRCDGVSATLSVQSDSGPGLTGRQQPRIDQVWRSELSTADRRPAEIRLPPMIDVVRFNHPHPTVRRFPTRHTARVVVGRGSRSRPRKRGLGTASIACVFVSRTRYCN